MRKALAVVILCCLGIIIYANTFQSPFQFDDGPNILKNLKIRNLADLSAIWHNWPTRFITFFTFALNYRFHKLDAFGYRLTNIVIHISSAILVWWLILLTLSTPVVKKDKISQHSDSIALFGALIFLSHPIQTGSVTYIYQRCASLTGFLYLLSLSIYVKSRLLEIKGNLNSNIRTLYILSLFFGVMAMLSKEHAFTLPLMVVLYEFCFLKGGNRLRWKRTLPFLFILPIIPVLLFTAKPVTFADVELLKERPVAGGYYLLTQIRVMVTYLKLLFIPLNQNLDYDYPISKSLFEPPTFLSFLLLIFILVIAIRIFSRYRLISFSIFWFFLTLLPESSIVPLGDLIFEHRLYLPMVGYSLFLTSIMYYHVGKKNFKPMSVILLVIVTSYSALTYARNFVWKDSFTLWNDTVRKSPNKARPYDNRGVAYCGKGNYDLAILDFNQAIKLGPNNVQAYKAYCNRGLAYAKKGNYDQAILDFNQAIKINPNFVDAYNNRGLTYYNRGNYDQAILDFNQAIKIDINFAKAYYNRGLAYVKKGNYDQAISDFNQAIKLNPNYVLAYQDRAVAYCCKKEYEKSWGDIRKVESLGGRVNPKFLETLKKASGRER